MYSNRCVADRFDVGKATAWRCVHKVVKALYSHLNTFITWPSRVRAEEIWTHVKNKYKFPKVIGAIDGTHIKIAAPKNHAEAYINRKGYHSIQLQVFFKCYIHFFELQSFVNKLTCYSFFLNNL